MRVDVTKILFIGMASQKDAFLTEFQHAGIAQFLGPKVTMSDLLATEFQETIQAIKVLKQYQVVQTPNVIITDPLAFSQRIISEKQALEELEAELKSKKELYTYVRPIGTIPLQAIASLEKDAPIRFRLWTALKKKNMQETCTDLIRVAETADRDYFLSLTEKDIHVPPGLDAIPLNTELTNLQDSIQQIHMKISVIEHELKRKAALIDSLKKALVEKVNTTKKQRLAESSHEPLEHKLFAMTAWIPETYIEKAYAIATSLNVFTDTLSLCKETPPTYLENQHVAKIGEDLISIYDTPSHTDRDPSLWVALFFTLFFAMIIGDGGYGLVFFITALLLRKKTTGALAKRTVTLTGILGIACILWGLCTHSFFSIELSVDNPIRAYSPLTYLMQKKAQYHMNNMNDEYMVMWRAQRGGLLPADAKQFLYESPGKSIAPFAGKIKDTVLLELSIIVGALHIIISMLRYVRRSISHIGWMIAIIGGYLVSAHYLEAPSMLYYLGNIVPKQGAVIGMQLLGGGVAFALISSLCQNGIAGLIEVMTMVQIFGDILSYLRIYALALAGAMIGTMANELAGQLPFIVAFVLIGLAHIVNIILSAVGGLIHGLRLNFLEWYHYCFEGGGKPFTPFTLEHFR